MPVDAFVDSGDRPLAAYQFEFTAVRGEIVGLEGGESVFTDAPYYDPAALHPTAASPDDRIIVAAFSTAVDLPRGVTRVARLHLLLKDVAPDASVADIDAAIDNMPQKLLVATDGGGVPIHANLSLKIAEGDGQ